MVKNRQNDASVTAFLEALEPDRRAECDQLCDLMSRATGAPPRMWGDSMVGFGSYHYVYASGRSGEWFITGFSPRKDKLSIYIMPGFSEFAELMSDLGRFKTGKSCLYIKKLSDVSPSRLEDLIARSVAVMESRYECRKG